MTNKEKLEEALLLALQGKLTESEDLSKTEQDIKEAVNDTSDTNISLNILADNINVLIADEEAAIDGYNGYIEQIKNTISDEQLINTLTDELQEIIDDEEEHIDKLKVIQASILNNNVENVDMSVENNEEE